MLGKSSYKKRTEQWQYKKKLTCTIGGLFVPSTLLKTHWHRHIKGDK